MTKRVTSPFSIWVDGSPRVYPGGTLIDDKDPILKTHGHLMEDVETAVAARAARRVEQTTAAPGEVRTLTPPSTPGPAEYDPGQDTVKGVLARLDQADEAEARRVLAAEDQGQARAGILKNRDDILARYAN